ncbi:ribonuclease H-like domain-containing protein [Halteromyces radiatus]|uniref:ribonuclease H-like domain-containing protein n=1 Tax=Halteromyces radiatus TaxID=101107 RepID=UPI00221EA7B4|nr:ribonuclease H-like domain-containing protein [Halteromyces radiatus]KAI8099247.1 ribonuclease H-like domain-containing protein [Halteromyces radiatus]
MTGLDLEKDHLIEIAVLITDGDLNIVAEGPEIIIHQPLDVMEAMNPWCVEYHGKSGLTKAVLESTVTTKQAEQQVLQFIKQQLPDMKGKIPLAGNSVHADKRFLEKEMPAIIDYLHYRIIDVSTIKELTKRWYPEVANSMIKRNKHRALDDIKESIDELKYYRQHVFVQNS